MGIERLARRGRELGSSAAWTHPLISLLQVRCYCHGRWSLPVPFSESLKHPSLQSIIDAYLQAWADYASPRAWLTAVDSIPSTP